MTLVLLSIGIATTVSTLIGGFIALRFKDSLHLILGFSAGAVIAVAFVDLLPEAIKLGGEFYGAEIITLVSALGLMFYTVLERSLTLLGEGEGNAEGHIGPASLTVHSFLDGLAIGLSFQVSAAVGTIVTIAVLVHDFSDGINTVNLSLIGHDNRKWARRWLIADALAPLLGIGASMLFHVPEHYLSLVLAIFSGFFIYIGVNKMLEESYHRHPHFWTSFMTVIGFAVLCFAIRITG